MDVSTYHCLDSNAIQATTNNKRGYVKIASGEEVKADPKKPPGALRPHQADQNTPGMQPPRTQHCRSPKQKTTMQSLYCDQNHTIHAQSRSYSFPSRPG
ncbi:hypothetical protein N7541_005346 [Penicillium brevicompactum]|uniref:Uncharacterized protein n=1 Tax=Penicillium brevicompactum TaxID=5074 RepID=A0A9W9RDE6_PENBR|nr:hypothetical protein N7541_005346 [Penicillium brevicompactum]